MLAGVGVPADAMDDVMSLPRRVRPRRASFRATAPSRRCESCARAGYKVGLITVCTEDVELLWPESAVRRASSTRRSSPTRSGSSKPDPRIYLACCEQLGVEPHEAVFVGDGANDELEGARRVGLRPILIHKAGEDPVWPEVRTWDGLRVTSIPEVLEVLERC